MIFMGVMVVVTLMAVLVMIINGVMRVVVTLIFRR
jgi:hypothetical protein